MDATVTRLLQACDQGDLHTIKAIVETSDGFDVNVAASFFEENGDEVMSATPLYLAARRCYLEVCQYLVGEGAAVNIRSIVKYEEDGVSSFSEYSPLHVAIFYLSRDENCTERKPTIEFLVANGADSSISPAEDGILYPIWTFCSLKEPALMMLLIDLDLILPSFPWCPEMGKTVLHHWASSGQDAVQIFEKLLDKGFDVNALDTFGLTPLKVAAIGYPDDLDSLGNPNEHLLRVLLHERDDISLSDKIEALELAGAALLLFKEDVLSISRGFQYWYEAQDLRDSAEVPITKALLNSDNTVHWRSNEWTARVQLGELQQRPLEDQKMQAFLVTRRLLAHISPSFLVDYLWFRHARDHCYRLYLDERYIEVIDICWLMLEGGQDPGIDEYWSMVVSASYWLVMSLCMLKDVQSPFLTFETWNLSLKLVLNSMNNRSPRLPSVTEYVENGALETISPIETVLQMITALSGSPEMLTPMAITQLEQFVQRDAIDRYDNSFFGYYKYMLGKSVLNLLYFQ